MTRAIAQREAEKQTRKTHTAERRDVFENLRAGKNGEKRFVVMVRIFLITVSNLFLCGFPSSARRRSTLLFLSSLSFCLFSSLSHTHTRTSLSLLYFFPLFLILVPLPLLPCLYFFLSICLAFESRSLILPIVSHGEQAEDERRCQGWRQQQWEHGQGAHCQQGLQALHGREHGYGVACTFLLFFFSFFLPSFFEL